MSTEQFNRLLEAIKLVGVALITPANTTGTRERERLAEKIVAFGFDIEALKMNPDFGEISVEHEAPHKKPHKR